MNQPWSAVISHYRSYAGESKAIRAVGALCEHIANGPLESALFAWASVFDLCITQTPVTYPYDGPFLRVSPRLDGLVEFRYIDTPQKSKQWVREEEPERVVSRLHAFLRQLKWVSEDHLAQ